VTGEEAVVAMGRGKERGAEVGGLPKGGMERGLEAESTSFSRYNRGECTARNGEEERETGERHGETGTRGKRKGGGEGTRKRRGIRDFVCSPVRPSEPEGTSAAASLQEELGETNTSAEETTAGEEGE